MERKKERHFYHCFREATSPIIIRALRFKNNFNAEKTEIYNNKKIWCEGGSFLNFSHFWEKKMGEIVETKIIASVKQHCSRWKIICFFFSEKKENKAQYIFLIILGGFDSINEYLHFHGSKILNVLKNLIPLTYLFLVYLEMKFHQNNGANILQNLLNPLLEKNDVNGYQLCQMLHYPLMHFSHLKITLIVQIK